MYVHLKKSEHKNKTFAGIMNRLLLSSLSQISQIIRYSKYTFYLSFFYIKAQLMHLDIRTLYLAKTTQYVNNVYEDVFVCI